MFIIFIIKVEHKTDRRCFPFAGEHRLIKKGEGSKFYR